MVDLWADLLRTYAEDWKFPVLAGLTSLVLLVAMIFYGSRLGNRNRATKCFCLAFLSHLLLFVGVAQIPPSQATPVAEDAVAINIRFESDADEPEGMDIARLESTIDARPETPPMNPSLEVIAPLSRSSVEQENLPSPVERQLPDVELLPQVSASLPSTNDLAEAAQAVPETRSAGPLTGVLPKESFQPSTKEAETPTRESPVVESLSIDVSSREARLEISTIEPATLAPAIEPTTAAPAVAPPPSEIPAPAVARLIPEPERAIPSVQEPSIASRPTTETSLAPPTPSIRAPEVTSLPPSPESKPTFDRSRPAPVAAAAVPAPPSAPPVRGLLTERQSDLERPEPSRRLPPLDDSSPTRPLETITSDATSTEKMLALRPSQEPVIPFPVSAPPTTSGNFWENRLAPNRREIVYRHGGSDETEKAVAKALLWLSRHQSEDGRWDSDGFTYACPDGELCVGHAVETESDTGLTGLALLAFLGAGHSHLTENPHQETVRKGLSWLLRTQKPDGDLQRGGRIYCHAMATLALTEAYAMSKDERLRAPAQKGVEWLAYAQHPESGGWRYGPKQYGDTSVYGWAVLVLRSARQAKLDVPDQTWKMAERWLPLVSSGSRGGLAAYRPGYPPSHAMTAEALFCRQVFGERPESALSEEAADYVMQRQPAITDYHIYYWYYGTLAMFQLGGQRWQRWNDRLTETLLSSQRQSGHAEGSWDPGKPFGVDGGRIFTTATSALCLEVYYRYLPMFAESKSPPKPSSTK